MQPNPHSLSVYCLCAQWCGTCKDYAATFQAVGQEFKEVHFGWIDIEDQADLVEPLEIENFPSILITRAGQARFFGTLTPHPQTLRRLVQLHVQDTDQPPAGIDPLAQALARRLTEAQVPDGS